MIQRSQIWGAMLMALLLFSLGTPALADAPADHAAAMAAAQEQGQPILLDFFTEW